MIGKIVKGGGFRGALNYDLQESKGRMLDTNMAGENERELAKEFGQIRKLRPQLGKAVLHVSLSAAPGEHLSDEQWREIGHKYLRGMGFGKSQFVMTRHNDTDHEHIHIIANRIRLDGSVVSDGMDFKRQETLMREIERSYGLQRVEPSENAERKAPTKGEIESYVRTGVPSTRTELQQLCDAAAKESQSITDYVRHLERFGVDVIPTTQKEGSKLSGLQYRKDGVVMKGSDLGKSYSPAGLAKRGISYEQDRDDAAVRRCQQREAGRGIGTAHEGVGQHRDSERSTVGRDAGAISAGHGRVDGGNATDTGLYREEGRAAGRNLQPADQEFSQVVPRSSERSAAGIEQSARRSQPDAMDTLPHDDGRSSTHCTAHERILALAGPAQSAEHDRQQSSRGAPETRRNRSLEAVERQIAGMGVDLVEIQILNATTGRNQKRQMGLEQLRRAMPWLKRENALGSDIYVRPAGDSSLVLLTGLTSEGLNRMRQEGCTPAVTIEESGKRFDAWVKVSEKPVPPHILKLVGEAFAERYGASGEHADGKSFGRLAGFTGQRNENGIKPYVLAHMGSGKTAPMGEIATRNFFSHMEKERLSSLSYGRDRLNSKDNDRGISR